MRATQERCVERILDELEAERERINIVAYEHIVSTGGDDLVGLIRMERLPEQIPAIAALLDLDPMGE